MSTLVMSQPTTALKAQRIQTIDLLRGVVMIIMALDHVRDYFHWSSYKFDPTDLGHTSVAIFFTRWITHFCAPTFFFLSGISAYLNGLKKTKKELAWFLFTRGLWLILLEFTVMNFAWYFDVHFTTIDFIIIWALGLSMVLMAGIIFLPMPIILLISLLLIGGHNLMDGFHVPGTGPSSFAWALIHDQNFFVYGRNLFVGYPIIPWVGVMAAGYCLGTIYAPDFDAAKRKRILISLGLGAVALFIV
ncbi:MAG TPA: heparan-alpha-glucosaminide N-acetyltransferase domain-containing protein, partial [Puia sp.]|nr:heparan-alpha-glucosaminide N-acetyltransferase domain-containing protein [Puia sp.]